MTGQLPRLFLGIALTIAFGASIIPETFQQIVNQVKKKVSFIENTFQRINFMIKDDKTRAQAEQQKRTI